MLNNRIARHLAAWLVTTICLVIRCLNSEGAGGQRTRNRSIAPADGWGDETVSLIHDSWIGRLLGRPRLQLLRVPRTNRSDGLTTRRDR